MDRFGGGTIGSLAWGASVALIGLGGLFGCTGSDSKMRVTMMMDSQGGTLEGPNGATVEVPAGALAEAVEISVSIAGAGFPALNALAQGQIYAFEPHGLSFKQPVNISVPHIGKPEEVAMYTAEPGGSWSKLAGEVGDAQTTVAVMHFSFFFNGREVCGLAFQECCDGECAGPILACGEDDICRPDDPGVPGAVAAPQSPSSGASPAAAEGASAGESSDAPGVATPAGAGSGAIPAIPDEPVEAEEPPVDGAEGTPAPEPEEPVRVPTDGGV